MSTTVLRGAESICLHRRGGECSVVIRFPDGKQMTIEGVTPDGLALELHRDEVERPSADGFIDLAHGPVLELVVRLKVKAEFR